MNEESFGSVISYIRRVTALRALQDSHWKPDHDELIVNFLTDPTLRLLTFFMDPDDEKPELLAHTGVPTRETDAIMCFIKRPHVTATISAVNYRGSLTVSRLNAPWLQALYVSMTTLYLPSFCADNGWPQELHEDFVSRLHQVMGHLTEQYYKLNNSTVLYVPDRTSIVRTTADVGKITMSRHLVERLEVAVLRWTKQVRSILSGRTSKELTDSSTLLDEIQFWHARHVSLSEVKVQLNEDAVSKVQRILELNESTCIARFKKLISKFNREYAQAKSNSKYLSLLQKPSEMLLDAELPECAKRLHRTINIVRFIWTNSPYYNSREQVSTVLRRVTEALVALCQRKISLDAIFDGRCVSSIRLLKECVECCRSWRNIYDKTADVHRKYSHSSWNLDEASIFLQLDAFTPRCNQLIEICTSQMCFCRQQDGDVVPLPKFCGVRGNALSSDLLKSESAFKTALEELSQSKQHVFDLKSIEWPTFFQKFQSRIKDVEMMLIGLLHSAFQTTRCVEDRVALLWSFRRYNTSKSIGLVYDGKVTQLFQTVAACLDNVRLEFSLKTVVLEPDWPPYAGQAMWADALRNTILSQVQFLECTKWLPKTGFGDEVKYQCREFSGILSTFIATKREQWSASVGHSPIEKLDLPLLNKCRDKVGHIESNFDRDLLMISKEAYFWERMELQVPSQCQEICRRRIELWALHHSVVDLCTSFNSILSALSADEKMLFKDRILHLRKKLSHGFTKLRWTNRTGCQAFVKDSEINIATTRRIVERYKKTNEFISRQCELIANMLLFNVDQTITYDYEQLVETQLQHRRVTVGKLHGIRNDISAALDQIFGYFEADSAEVLAQWNCYVSTVDGTLMQALRCNVQQTHQRINSMININAESNSAPLVKISVHLSHQIELKTSLHELSGFIADYISTAARELADWQPLNKADEVADSKASQTIKHDKRAGVDKYLLDEAKSSHTQSEIKQGLVVVTKMINDYLSSWKNFSDVWTVEPAAFMENYQETNPTASDVDKDIQRYMEMATRAEIQEAFVVCQFVMLESAHLKQAIVQRCERWQSMFCQLLLSLAERQMNDFLHYANTNSDRLKQVPQSLSKLKALIELHAKLTNEKATKAEELGDIHPKLSVLKKYEIPVEGGILADVHNLQPLWENYCQLLTSMTGQLEAYKDRFRAGLLSDSAELKKLIFALIEEFHTSGPLSNDWGTHDAQHSLTEYHKSGGQLQQREVQINNGLKMFDIVHRPCKELQHLIETLSRAKHTWNLVEKWRNLWRKLLQQKVLQMDLSTVCTECDEIKSRLSKIGGGSSLCSWDVVEQTKLQIEEMVALLPLLTSLKNDALRHRHWQKILALVNKSEEDEKEITLEQVIQWQMGASAQEIANLSACATKELSVENLMAKVESVWSDMVLDVQPHKESTGTDGGVANHVCRPPDTMFQTLDDNQVSLSAVKSSRYVEPFRDKVLHWEGTLTNICNVVESLMTAQQQWLNMENIFHSEDVQKEMPTESDEFDQVTEVWNNMLAEFKTDLHIMAISKREGLIEMLTQMTTRLETIQKGLEVFLENKCAMFLRFYFISNNDLLDILGHSKDPGLIQLHLNKMFANIQCLQFSKRESSSETVISGVIAVDGEDLPLVQAVVVKGSAENWLNNLEAAVKETIGATLYRCSVALKNTTHRHRWLLEWPGQLCITATQILWTADTTKALALSHEAGDKNALKSLRKQHGKSLAKYVESVRASASTLHRLKAAAMITIEVHARDVLDRMMKSGVDDANNFEWQSQIRLYLDKKNEVCSVCQMNSKFAYGREYVGTANQIVVTPLTDRCYMALTCAMHLQCGACLNGSNVAGKTETLKSLAKTLAMFLVVFNCSDSVDHRSTSRLLSGVAQSGCWGCFEQFDQISSEVRSVTGHQIQSILQALAAASGQVELTDTTINLVKTCSIFITTKHAFAGHSTLPENLQLVFRPVAVVAPDLQTIAEVSLLAEGFNDSKQLARKIVSLLHLASCQLGQHSQYDFGIRTMVVLIRCAAELRRTRNDLSEEEVIIEAMSITSKSKMNTQDCMLFSALVNDLFPDVAHATVQHHQFDTIVQEQFTAQTLQVFEYMKRKVRELYDAKRSCHSTILVGNSGSGKTTTWRTLQLVMRELHRRKTSDHQPVTEYLINPKSLSPGELYGEYDVATASWTDGVLASIMKAACKDTSDCEKWVVLDGPVDPAWAENLNSMMDGNRVLTLANAERIVLPPQVSVLFEVETLATASPATVSRCAVVYFDCSQLGWRHYVDSWLQSLPCSQTAQELRPLFEIYLDGVLAMKQTECRQLVASTQLTDVKSLCRLLGCFCSVEHGVDARDVNTFSVVVRLWFIFCVIWSVCACVDEESRRTVDRYMRETDASFPNKDTVFDYVVDVENCAWRHWNSLMPQNWRYSVKLPFHKIHVPTIDTLRYDFLLNVLLHNKHAVLMAGAAGVGKSTLVDSMMSGLDEKLYSNLNVRLSAKTSSSDLQVIVENRLDKRSKNTFVPKGGKQLLVFLDDINMPAKDAYGSKPPLELLRFWMEYGFWYDRKKQSHVRIQDVQLVSAMRTDKSGDGTWLPQRLQSKFNVIYFTSPGDSQMKSIFGVIMQQKLHDFSSEVQRLSDQLTQATIDIHRSITANILPLPSKIHHMFSMRDISKVFQGLFRAHRNQHKTRISMLRLWIHECLRVYSDRFVDTADYDWFMELLKDKLGSYFDLSFQAVCPSKQTPLFGDFMNSDGIYCDLEEGGHLQEHVESCLVEYNGREGVVHMNLVLFRDAVSHLCRIVRVLRQPRGHLLLLGVGACGRRSILRLAAFMCKLDVFAMQDTHAQYTKRYLRDSLRTLYKTTGVHNKPTLFLINDSQLTDESLLDDVNCLLNSTEVPNLFSTKELEEIHCGLRPEAEELGVPDTYESLQSLFMERVHLNLHVSVCMSPEGGNFRRKIRNFPSLVYGTTVDYFGEWSSQSLLETCQQCLKDSDLIQGASTALTKAELHSSVAAMFGVFQRSAVELSRRVNSQQSGYSHVPSSNILRSVDTFKRLFQEKRSEIDVQLDRLLNGLKQIERTSDNVQLMSVELKYAKSKVAEFQYQCEEYLVRINHETKEADSQQKYVQIRSQMVAEEEKQCQEMARTALGELQEVMPIFEDAVRALDTLSKRDLNEIKSYSRPPPLVELVTNAVMTLLCVDPSWAEAKRQLGDANFLTKLRDFDKDNISDKTLKKIGVFVSKVEFDPDTVGKQSAAARSLCLWVRAIESYGRVYRIVEPKKRRVDAAEKLLSDKKRSLEEAQQKLEKLGAYLVELRTDYQEKMQQKEDLGKNAESLATRLDRAAKIVSGFVNEKTRWTGSVAELYQHLDLLVGNCLLTAAFINYLAPFSSHHRLELLQLWSTELATVNIPHTEDFSLSKFMLTSTLAEQLSALPLGSDDYSVQNAIVVLNAPAWPLLIDPQCQATTWIVDMEQPNNLVVVGLHQADFLDVLRRCILAGLPMLIQNDSEEFDPVLNPLFAREFIHKENGHHLSICQQELLCHEDFRLYISTKLSNPRYSAQLFSHIVLVNFAVTPEGLEQQLLDIVVQKESPELEEQRDNLMTTISAGKHKLLSLDNQVLDLLTQDSLLLEDERLANTLHTCRTTAASVNQQLDTAHKTQAEVDSAREGYRSCARRAALLFSVITEMQRVDTMYLFSLDCYIDIFQNSIHKARRSAKLHTRLNNINELHTYELYKYVYRGLLERHKLLFSFHLCMRLLDQQTVVEEQEYCFLLYGGVVANRKQQMDNPFPDWLSEKVWDNISELEKMGGFQGLIQSFEQLHRDWFAWYTDPEPEKRPLPGKWETSCSDFQRVIFVRALRPDRLPLAIVQFVSKHLTAKFVEAPVSDLGHVLESSSSVRTPLLFILCPGADAMSELQRLARTRHMNDRLHCLSLGEGQTAAAMSLVERSQQTGDWVYLANCHLDIAFMTQLALLLEKCQSDEVNVNDEHRLWLSSMPHHHFPVSILQNSVKITTEPPRGIKPSMKRLYSRISETQFSQCPRKDCYKKLLFSLCFLHTVLIERRKFNQLGWNNIYDFSDGDFENCETLLRQYLSAYDKPPLEALSYIVGEVIYGGHVIDQWDRRLLMTYVNQFICADTIGVNYYKLCSVDSYFVPRDGSLGSYRDHVDRLPSIDHPQLFGQHANADIATGTIAAHQLCAHLKRLAPHATCAQRHSENTLYVGEVTNCPDNECVSILAVEQMASDIIEKLPLTIDAEMASKMLAVNDCPVNIVLCREVGRYNTLLASVRRTLDNLVGAAKGEQLISSDQEQTTRCLLRGKVPQHWHSMYPSERQLGSWLANLTTRVGLFERWLAQAQPPTTLCLSHFSAPRQLLIAVLQTAARERRVPIDALEWNFRVLPAEETPPSTTSFKDGIYVDGMFLEGAVWDPSAGCLAELPPMKVRTVMPVVHFKPVETRRKTAKGMYNCPLFHCTKRAGTTWHPSHVLTVELPVGQCTHEHWTQRAVALLLDAEG